jgi:hypothetical protein
MSALAEVLSFGEDAKYELVRELTPVHVCLVSLNSSNQPIQDIATVTDLLFNLRAENIEGIKVESAQVVWVNVPNAEHNPFSETGYLLTKIYAHNS